MPAAATDGTRGTTNGVTRVHRVPGSRDPTQSRRTKFVVNVFETLASLFFSRMPSGWRAGLRRRRARVQIAAAMLSGNSLRQTVHTHCAPVDQAAKLVAALLRVARVTAGLAENNRSLPSGL